MPEIISDKKVFSLSEVLKSVKRTLETRYSSAFWVKAEMNKLNYYKHSGHCYPDLVDKSDGKVVAETRAVLWSTDYNRINRRFLTILKEPLKDGIKILFSAKIQFDPKYGLSLQIIDIDPSYTLGDLEMEKQETIKRLNYEKIFNKNKLIPLPLLPQRLAIISVETSKGYADFLSVTANNQWGYQFFHTLFPSLLQGDRAAASLIGQLNRIRKVADYFDAVAIIRGGGGEVGLTCYNNYELAKTICEFPIPVITGIGHATNETVAEMVAHTNAITPTKLAEFLIQHFHQFRIPVEEAERRIAEMASRFLADKRSEFYSTIRFFKSVTNSALAGRKHELGTTAQHFKQNTFIRFFKSKQELANMINYLTLHSGILLNESTNSLSSLERDIRNMHPDNVLKRGYSITLYKGKSVTDAAGLQAGVEVETRLAQGSFKSVIKELDTKTQYHE